MSSALDKFNTKIYLEPYQEFLKRYQGRPRQAIGFLIRNVLPRILLVLDEGIHLSRLQFLNLVVRYVQTLDQWLGKDYYDQNIRDKGFSQEAAYKIVLEYLPELTQIYLRYQELHSN